MLLTLTSAIDYLWSLDPSPVPIFTTSLFQPGVKKTPARHTAQSYSTKILRLIKRLINVELNTTKFKILHFPTWILTSYDSFPSGNALTLLTEDILYARRTRNIHSHTFFCWSIKHETWELPYCNLGRNKTCQSSCIQVSFVVLAADFGYKHIISRNLFDYDAIYPWQDFDTANISWGSNGLYYIAELYYRFACMCARAQMIW